jgi:hypothetical protein
MLHETHGVPNPKASARGAPLGGMAILTG